MNKVNIAFVLNGQTVSTSAEPNKRLLDMLREDFLLTGVKEGCSEGECGACTVLVNDEAVTSCCVLAPQVDGCEVLTIEGLAQNGELDGLQQAFLDAGAVQCGFCTPGMILSARALLMRCPQPSIEQIKEAIAGNLCRCTGYSKIIEAIQIASGQKEG